VLNGFVAESQLVHRLRPVEWDDIEVFHEHQADPSTSAMIGLPSRTRDAHNEHWTRLLDNPELTIRTVEVWARDPDRWLVAGNILTFPLNGQLMLGYCYGREFWGWGLATRSVGEYLVGFADRPLSAHVVEHNLGSLRVLKRNGFRRVGEFIDGDGARVLDHRLD
jgi:RimJ/RimL family protein N-acetyltransferase